MSSETYKDAVIVSRPTKHADENGWIPQVTIFWNVAGQQHWHVIERDVVFSDEASAVSEGFVMGRLWADQKF
jgi:hypothetical protein